MSLIRSLMFATTLLALANMPLVAAFSSWSVVNVST